MNYDLILAHHYLGKHEWVDAGTRIKKLYYCKCGLFCYVNHYTNGSWAPNTFKKYKADWIVYDKIYKLAQGLYIDHGSKGSIDDHFIKYIMEHKNEL